MAEQVAATAAARASVAGASGVADKAGTAGAAGAAGAAGGESLANGLVDGATAAVLARIATSGEQLAGVYHTASTLLVALY